MNSHTVLHLHTPATIRANEQVDALIVEQGGSTLGIFLSQIPAADRIAFLNELAAQATFLSSLIADRTGAAA